MRRLPAAALLALAFAGAADAEADVAVPALPPEAQVRQVLSALPQVESARALLRAEEANSRRLAAGNYEWSVKAIAQRRTEAAGQRYLEHEIAVERPLRLYGKAGKDAALGTTGIEVAEARLADTWHEAARGLQRAWFDWLREEGSARRLDDNARLLAQQLDIVRRRVRSGDAPRLEEMLAETELLRAQATQAQSRARAGRLLAELRLRYPGLPADPAFAAAVPALPTLPGGDSTAWQARILSHNHEIELAELEALQARLSSERALLERRPDPTVGVRYAQERDRQERILGVAVSVPFSGTARSAAADAALARADAAAQKARETRMRVQADAAQVTLRAHAAASLAERLRTIAEQAQANAALVGKAYSLGEAPLSETLLARRQALEAVTQFEQSGFDALEANARLLLDMHEVWSLREHHAAQER